jgi:hypothetical protein
LIHFMAAAIWALFAFGLTAASVPPPRTPAFFLSRILDNRNYPDRSVMPTWLLPADDSPAGAPLPVLNWSG